MEDSREDSKFPLLEQSVHCDVCHRGPTSKRSWLRSNALSLGAFLLLLYIAAMLTFVPRGTHQAKVVDELVPQLNDRFTLPHKLLEFEDRIAWLPPHDPSIAHWSKGPSQETDDLWDHLLHALNIRVTSDEVAILGLNTTNRMQLNDGDYVGVLGVYHHLHCLNNMRIVLHWDYYKEQFKNFDRPYVFSVEHADHCINTLRQSIMCNANTEMHLGEWLSASANAKELSGESMATCLKWESLDNWARPRAIVAGQFDYKAHGTGKKQ
ncbi:hypothetical protein F5Y14DRAFT_94902 [Nemania sp. NC0429]|nr:hypothetical protein F5Y14DRAFT_94902 [Nemania sp. NC0429]